ncbi:hypothetical protein [Fervidibacillus halotolerans]|uniref:Uncharacterized protein n=1 Tax=Fervidibacillus halotolerans TaxID=2980027 RepID=A0A9E8M0Z0_9BACI|nr:hypothetical protein [Fervidibacillus halotolerans]WAA13435.1 hypothetical protein OE105_04805 [Fervidibacillus halotolerans]
MEWALIPIVFIIAVFSPAIIGIITDHKRKTLKLKNEMLKEEVKLEQIKHENYLLETEKMRLELEKMQLENKTRGLCSTDEKIIK